MATFQPTQLYFESTPKEIGQRFLRCSVEINAYINRKENALIVCLVCTQILLQLQEKTSQKKKHYTLYYYYYFI